MSTVSPSSSAIRSGPYKGLPRRPKADRSKGLVLDQVRQLVNAANYAEAISLPLNAMITFKWSDSEGFALDDWGSIQLRLFNRMCHWLRRKGITSAFIWTRERVPGRGAHTHLLLHMGSQPKRLRSKLYKYLKEIGRFQTAQGVNISFGTFGAMNVSRRAGLQRYIGKSFDHRQWRYLGPDGETQNLGVALGIDHRGSQGIVSIKRAGTSETLGRKARRLAGWREVRDVEGLRRLLNPEDADRVNQ